MGLAENGSLRAGPGDAQSRQMPAQPPYWIGFILGFLVMGAQITADTGDLPENSLLLILGLVLGIIAFFLYCVYKLHKILKVLTNGDYPISPGEAVGCHFLPLYNFYWIFKWPAAFSKYINQSRVTQMAPGWVLGLILFSAGLIVDRLVPALAVFMQFGVVGYMSFKLGEHAGGFTGAPDPLPDKGVQPPAAQPAPASPMGLTNQASPAAAEAQERKETQAGHFTKSDKSSIRGDLPGLEQKNDERRAGPSRETQTFFTTPHFGLGRGTKFADRYLVIEELGQGGMGKVYRVEDTKIKEDVALKFLKPDISSDKFSIERFRNELKLARKISHKNVCRMYHFGESDGCLFITMEYVAGEDLTCTLRRVGPLSPAKAVFIAGQIADGLTEAHRLGVIHRDLKPKNIMIDQEGSVRIMDFGIARILNTRGVTTAGTMVGTPEYMAPEQASGKRVDRRSDIYALGIILYEMVTGQVPFHGETALATAWKHKHEPPCRPEALNDQVFPALSRIIMKCMEKRPEKRYQDVHELKTDLEALHIILPKTDRIIPEKKSSMEKIRTLLTSRNFRLPAAAAGILIASAAAWFLFLKPGDGREQPPVNARTVPSDIEYLAAGRAALGEGDYKLALARFRQAVEEEDTEYPARISIGDVFREQGKIDEAVEEYERAVTLNKEDPRAYLRLGSLFEGAGKIEIAGYYYQRFINNFPEHPQRAEFENKIRLLAAEPQPPSPSEKIERPSISDHLSQGIQSFNQGDYNACIAWMETVIKRNPEHEQAREYMRRSQEQLALPPIKELLNKYRTALQNGTLPQFYGDYCLPESLSRIKMEAELIARSYSDLECFVSEVDINLTGKKEARAEFSHIITGVTRSSGIKSVLFEGTMIWSLIKEDKSWRIKDIESRRAGGMSNK
jgi:serine/threonine protein kinase